VTRLMADMRQEAGEDIGTSLLTNIKETALGLPKWKLLLVFGSPVVLMGGVYYLLTRGTGGARTKTAPPVAKVKPNSASLERITPRATDAKPQSSLDVALNAKNRGNKLFKLGKYDEAITQYTKAISECPIENPNEASTFYQNRAAAFDKLKVTAKVIEDCTSALRNDEKYIKALIRRSKAYEQSGMLTECLEDVTAVCILEEFNKQESLETADRVLKALGKKEAGRCFQTGRQPVIPSHHFIRTYFSAFANDPIYSKSFEEEKEKDETEEQTESSVDESPFIKAHKILVKSHDYVHILPLCTQELECPGSKFKFEALLLKATFLLMQGCAEEARTNLDTLLNNGDEPELVPIPIKVNALIKRGSLRMQALDHSAALADFEEAELADPLNSDIFHHRGQLHLLLENMDSAVKDFEKCIMLSPDFAVAQLQSCYTHYRYVAAQRQSQDLSQDDGNSHKKSLEASLKQFEILLDRFPECAEGWALYGQALLDQQQFAKADEMFRHALKVEPDNANVYVHLGLLWLQWKYDPVNPNSHIEACCSYFRKALEVDSKCEFAYETLGTIEVQRGELKSAMVLFQSAIRLAKTEMEMAHLFSLCEAAKAQLQVAERLGINLPKQN